MDTGGSGSVTESGSSKSNASSTPPPPPPASHYGLKFGKKIYFEDHEGGSSSSSGRKKGGGGGQPARCQVEGCKADLSGLKAYYSRHKVCGSHSKSPKVIVAGLEQRFCQQCSRFHQLPEFDQGKRSCRRRLAGHNERRRKPQPGSILSRCGHLCSSLSENSSRSGSFILDFTAHPGASERDVWPTARSSERLLGGETYTMGRSISQPWQNSVQNHPSSNLYLQGGSTGGTGFTSTGIHPGVSVSDSSCALSLLSNQQWGARNEAPAGAVNSLLNSEGAPFDQSTPHHGATLDPYSSPSWGYKDHEPNSSLQDFNPGLGRAQFSQPMNSQFGDELELSHQNRRQFVGLDRSRGYDSPTQHIQWSL